MTKRGGNAEMTKKAGGNAEMTKKAGGNAEMTKKAGGGAAEFATEVYGAAGEQHAVSDTDHTIHMNASVVGHSGGASIADNAAPYEGGKTRRSKRGSRRRGSRKLTPWNLFVKKHYRSHKATNKSYSFKQALKDAAKLYKSK
jgi:hypothetical protein